MYFAFRAKKMKSVVNKNILVKMQTKIEELEKTLQEKDEKISDLEAFVSYYKEELENYQRLNERKLKAYEAILEM